MNLNGLDLVRRLLKSGASSEMPLTIAANRNEMQTEAFLRFLLKETRKKEGWEAPLLQTRYVVVDTETTGFDPATDCLLSLGAVVMQGDRVLTEETFHSHVKVPDSCSIPPHITKLTGITESDTQNAPALGEVLSHFLRYAKDGVLVMHHSGHDIRFLNAALWKTCRAQLTHRIVDTHKVAKWLQPALGEYNLDQLLVQYQIPVNCRHNALADAIMTAQLWKCFINEALQKETTTLGELIQESIVANRK